MAKHEVCVWVAGTLSEAAASLEEVAAGGRPNPQSELALDVERECQQRNGVSGGIGEYSFPTMSDAKSFMKRVRQMLPTDRITYGDCSAAETQLWP